MTNEKFLFGLPAEHIPYAPESTELVISSEALADYYHVNNSIYGVRNLAARSIRKIRRRQRQLGIALQDKLAKENEFRLQQMIDENEKERKRLLAETVQWLVEEQDIEHKLYLAAMQKAQQWAIEALKQWGIEADWNDALYMRVKAMLKQFEKEPNLVLALPSEELANTFAANLSKNPEYSQSVFQVVVDSKLALWQARLGNSLVSVFIDMHTELDDILSQLRSQPVSGVMMTAEYHEQD